MSIRMKTKMLWNMAQHKANSVLENVRNKRLHKRGVGTATMVGLLVTAILLGALGPVIFQQLSAFAGDGNLTAAEAAIAAVLGIFVMVAILLGILRQGGVKVNMSK